MAVPSAVLEWELGTNGARNSGKGMSDGAEGVSMTVAWISGLDRPPR